MLRPFDALQYEVSVRTRHPLLPAILATVLLIGMNAGLAHAQTVQETIEFDSLRQALGRAAQLLGSQQSASTIVALTSIEVATAPLGTSTGGFTFTFDPVGGRAEPSRSSTSTTTTIGAILLRCALRTGGVKPLHDRRVLSLDPPMGGCPIAPLSSCDAGWSLAAS